MPFIKISDYPCHQKIKNYGNHFFFLVLARIGLSKQFDELKIAKLKIFARNQSSTHFQFILYPGKEHSFKFSRLDREEVFISTICISYGEGTANFHGPKTF
ncbi:unnamed protein product [Blepharisma stoltei]|uniref:Uncharacterized protein n=1 Tax=Blepharisma stoltei TaxID=1481888 RepID=A0AAU9K9R2_9CILI|nr:unnamed protein product [Blepharisma stoltei]